jgi:[acyl-carrier-protein] S-malonyltransferase
MEPARDGLENAVNSVNIQIPNAPIIANITARPIKTVKQIKKELVSQICECVQWKRSIEYMILLGVTNFIEIGPGNTLHGMLKRIDKSVGSMSIGNFNSIQGLTLK